MSIRHVEHYASVADEAVYCWSKNIKRKVARFIHLKFSFKVVISKEPDIGDMHVLVIWEIINIVKHLSVFFFCIDKLDAFVWSVRLLCALIGVEIAINLVVGQSALPHFPLYCQIVGDYSIWPIITLAGVCEVKCEPGKLAS